MDKAFDFHIHFFADTAYLIQGHFPGRHHTAAAKVF